MTVVTARLITNEKRTYRYEPCCRRPMSAPGGSGNVGVEEWFGLCEGFRMPAASDVPRAMAAGVRKPPREETAIWVRRPGRVGPQARLWRFERWAGRFDGQATGGLS